MRRPSLRSTAWATLLAAVVCWAAAVVSAPILGRPASGKALGTVAAGAYAAGAVICHQRTGRSFHLAGAQLPVCGRCTGFYLAAAAGVLLALAGASAARRGKRHRAWLLLAAAPSLAAIALEWFGPWTVSNAWRAVAAAPIGLVVGALLVEAAGFRGRL